MAEDKPRRPSRWKGWAALVAVLLAAAGGGWWLYTKHPWSKGGGEGQEIAGKRDQAVPVKAADAATSDFPVTLTGLGTVQAINNVTVRAQISGQILHIDFKEGQKVAKGDLLVEIDPRPLQAALSQAQAKLAQDQASLKDAKVNLERLQTLAAKQFATRQSVDTQTALVNQDDAQVKSDQAAIANAQTQLSYASIRAPIPGRVGFRLADVGTLVGPSDADGIVSIQQVQPIAVIFTAPEEALGAINKAMGAGVPPVDALSSDGTQKLAEGRLTRVNNEVDVASGTIRLKAVFTNEDDSLWPGQSVSTRLLIETRKNMTVVPALAVQHGPDGLFVYVVGKDDKAEMRKVEIGPQDDERAVVLKGVKPGEKVITAGQYRVQNGVKVAVEAAGQPAKQASAARSDGRQTAQD